MKKSLPAILCDALGIAYCILTIAMFFINVTVAKWMVFLFFAPVLIIIFIAGGSGSGGSSSSDPTVELGGEPWADDGGDGE